MEIRKKGAQGGHAVTPIDEVHELDDDALAAAAGGRAKPTSTVSYKCPTCGWGCNRPLNVEVCPECGSRKLFKNEYGG